VYKNYKHWFVIKKKINNKKHRSYFSEREIWNCYVGQNIGYEQDGVGENFLRPVLILKKINRETGVCVPLTKKGKQKKYYFALSFGKDDSYFLLTQIKFFDAKRLLYRMGKIDKKLFQEIKIKITKLLP
jgi:mRNA interferase MazF